MRKGKNVLMLLLAAVIIAVCALLPGLVSAVHDGTTIGKNHFETVPNIRLEIRGEAKETPLKMLSRMSLMDGGLEIPEKMASMDREEAEARAMEILQSYIGTGLVPSFEPEVYESRSILATVNEDPSLNGIYWMITLIDENTEFDLAIDDQSGSALAVSFAGGQALSEGKRDLYISVFPNLYFTGLGLDDYVYYVTADLKDMYVGENNRAARYRFKDDDHGEVTVDFYVNEYGFYNEFPNLGGLQ